MEFINQVTDILELRYRHGWDERNGGNLSYLLSDEEADCFKEREGK